MFRFSDFLQRYLGTKMFKEIFLFHIPRNNPFIIKGSLYRSRKNDVYVDAERRKSICEIIREPDYTGFCSIVMYFMKRR